MDPMSMMSGAPSFQGGDSGPAFSDAKSSSTLASDFTVYGSGSDKRAAIQWGAIVVFALGAIWLATRK